VPERSRWWIERHPQFAGHLLGRYHVAACESGVGLLVDLGKRQDSERTQGTLAEVVDRLVDSDRYAPVLAWTELDLESLSAGRNLFTAPPGYDGELPYLDHTVDVVVVDDRARLEEGRRVARRAVVVVSADESGRVSVTEVDHLAAAGQHQADPILLAVAVNGRDDPWFTHLEEAVAEQSGVEILASRDPWTAAMKAEAEVSVLAERGVLPLPGCIEAAAAALTSGEQVGGAAMKLLAADGSLEAAGRIVFADGSVKGIGSGNAETAEPWHEYVHPVCAGAGLLAVRREVLREASKRPGSLLGLPGKRSRSLLALSGAVWKAGCELLYQPDALAVRILEPDLQQVKYTATKEWASVLPDRPERPALLDSRAWQSLLVEDDLKGCWR
jgi:hypothetical protein